MNRMQKWILFCVVVFLMTNGVYYAAFADHDEDKEKRWYHKILDLEDDDDENHKNRKRKRERRRDNDHNGSYLKPVNNPTYKEECGACHFAYQPELLPSASWMKILDNLDDHFGESIELDNISRKAISDYLKSNSAEYSSAKHAVKIMRSLGEQIPLRITDIPIFREKHHEISASVFKSQSVTSLSNCIACHRTADQGIYDDDNVDIPR